MRRSRSPALSCCTAFGRGSSDCKVSVSKIKLRLQSGMRCFEPELCTASQGSSARGGYLHQSHLIKDLGFFETGEPATFGSNLFKDFIAYHETAYVTRCKKAGLVFMGRSSSPEFGLNPNTE